MVGSPKCITCQWFERKLEKDGKAYVHCNRL
nr:MAG TPA: KaiB domain [Caudoviricetes sp.]DAS22250.1 MAG TPA: KaiB domain [Caudoviricetes sp.]